MPFSQSTYQVPQVGQDHSTQHFVVLPQQPIYTPEINNEVPRATKTSKDTLGSPFNAVADAAAAIVRPGNARHASSTSVDVTKTGVGKPSGPGQSRRESGSKVGYSSVVTAAAQQADPNNGTFWKNKAFPSVADMEAQAQAIADAKVVHREASFTVKPSSSYIKSKNSRDSTTLGQPPRKRVPPPISGSTARPRKVSAAGSDVSVKKDDLLERLAEALRTERRIRADFEAELQIANDDLDKVSIERPGSLVCMLQLIATLLLI